MAESDPPESPINAATIPPPSTATTAAAAAIVPAAAAITITTTTNNNHSLGPSLAPKRQRRPSVRLGEIGDQPGRPKHWRFHKEPNLAAKSSKTRPLTNLVNGGVETLKQTEDNLDFGYRKQKSKRPQAKRVRTNWTLSTKIDNGAEGDSREEEFRDFEAEEGSESPFKEQSPIHSIDNVGLDFWNRRTGRARVSESRDREQDEGIPESDSRDRKCGTSRDGNFGSGGSERGRNWSLDDGVRNWLIGLGLGRYAPVFEIHEVDDEVLPMLTLEDLKDMGINAVGSRRKMYAAIQKLPKGYS
ncbi:uncharacterized protein LOC114283470 [Camellia sinensis]|uniref:uncharacterized protein LOC114283470 n=1 Tax=Camellia sinensis TaxID=4442 RepID=UPI001035F6F8|nr:uncharacterized protein LOC114283470 [Camellia sinensis]XP_028082092.1 uncharacterized protein LOC114283470 [Camellia sinensis]XP_028082101.1 uncharacterized protein LOC114283470 [Camellia sinensis]XP_028082111.1 uncharacterized protein LOC114283470 [Camellia sinensis]XP_028082118.1 uncharacterized protein LOC114283470 [Camellia sinensis]XP_028082129.1 uncharacterized protein LOC114283470 [Camellia sinensis]XP_028082137.1 uncharacterized protein LOC114283470 [Camellia sinensis]XP_02808214